METDRTQRPLVSVVVPVHNGAKRLPALLGSLAEQLVSPCAFEVIVVDNASSDRSAQCAERGFAGLRARGVPCCVTPEPRLGLQFARQRGGAHAHAPIVAFLDDDAIPSPRYLAAGLAAMRDESVGLLVSRVFPRWESPPPPSLLRRSYLFAINADLGDGSIDFGAGAVPAPTLGVGLWVRRELLLKALAKSRVPDRTGDLLISGGDIEIGMLVGELGYRRLYVPGLALEHCIPSSRLEPRYVSRLVAGIARSELLLADLYPQFGPARGVGRLRRLGSLALALAAIPFLLTRRDGLSEVRIVLADRWAKLRGAYPVTDDPARAG